MFSEDKTTLIFNAATEDGVDSNQASGALDELRNKVHSVGLDHIPFEVTSVAGISLNTIALFKMQILF